MSVIRNSMLTRFFSSAESRGRASFRIRVALGALAVVVLVYLGYAFFAFSMFYGRDLHYPDAVFAGFDMKTPPGGAGSPSAGSPAGGGEPTPGGPETPISEAGRPDEGSATGTADSGGDPAVCEESRTVAMQQALIRYIVRDNLWVPARPVYKLGFFGLVDFEDTPWFDNKASEQLGVLDVMRRMAVELTDALGRVRGTSLQNEDLANAQAALRINERAWYFNSPFNSDVNTVSPGAAASYEDAIRLYEAYNDQLAVCDAVFDTRSDNLREVLSRFTATLGSTTTELAQRSRAHVYDPETDRFVSAEGNNRGWFDFRADNYFHRARGKMYALHGLLQGVRADFNELLTDRNVHAVWDKMEVAIAEAAVMDPAIVSNGSADSAVRPDHLGKMAEIILRARASMVELRDILRD